MNTNTINLSVSEQIKESVKLFPERNFIMVKDNSVNIMASFVVGYKERKYGIIVYNDEVVNKLSEKAKNFLVDHEKYHLINNKKLTTLNEEVNADLYAARKNKLSKKQIEKIYTEVLSKSNINNDSNDFSIRKKIVLDLI